MNSWTLLFDADQERRNARIEAAAGGPGTAAHMPVGGDVGVLPALQVAMAAAGAPAASGVAQQRSSAGAQHSALRASSDAGSGRTGGGSAGAGGEVDSRVDAMLANPSHHGPGHLLAQLRREQTEMGVSEFYSREHAARLRDDSARPYCGPTDKALCIDTHPQPCHRPDCKSCHFCRQKSIHPKTHCAHCEGRANRKNGGPGRGMWCGSCLWVRMGENIDEVLRLGPAWRCPACRDLCNCSGSNCQRSVRGLLPTNQLHGEATRQGYQSVAHYLVLTHISATARAAPLGESTGEVAAVRAQRRPRALAGGEPPAKRQKLVLLREESERVAAQEIDGILAELRAAGFALPTGAPGTTLGASAAGAGGASPSGATPAASNDAFLRELGFGRSILDADLEEDEEDEPPPAPAGAAAHTGQASAAAGASRHNSVLGAQRPGASGLAHHTPCPGGSEAGGGGTRGGWSAELPAPPGAAGAAASTQRQARLGALRPPRLPGQQRWVPLQDPALPGADSPLHLPPAAAAWRQVSVPPSVGASGGSGGSSAAGASAALPAIDAMQVDGGDASLSGAAGSAAAAKTQQQAQQQAQQQQQAHLEGLLSRDDACFHGGVPGGDGGVPTRLAAGYRPATAAPRALGGAPAGSTVDAGPQQRNRASQQAHVTPCLGRQSHLQQPGSMLPPPPRMASRSPEGARLRRKAPAEARPGMEQQQLQGLRPEGEAQPMDVDGGAADASQQLGLTPPHHSAPAAGTAEPAVDQAQLAAELTAPAPTQQTELPAARALAVEAGAARGGPRRPAPPVAAEDDAARWDLLLRDAAEAARCLRKCDPQEAGYAAPVSSVLAAVDPEELYAEQYHVAMARLNDCLSTLEAAMFEECGVTAATHQLGSSACTPPIYSHAGLRSAVDLLCLLARELPDREVAFQVQRRLLGQELFVDFKRCDARGRIILISGYARLAEVLATRGLDTTQCCATIAAALTQTADDIHEASRLLSAAIDSSGLPETDITVGHWRYDAAARAQEVREWMVPLAAYYVASVAMLGQALRITQDLCVALRHDSPQLVPPSLLTALLGHGRSLPASVQRSALAMLYWAVQSTSAPREGEQLGISAVEINRRHVQRLRMADMVEQQALPLLERIVAAEYPFWREVGQQSDPGEPGAAGAPSSSSGPSGADRVGSEKVETLARCYAFLLELRPQFWQTFEARLTRPFSAASFWRLAFSSPQRHFTVFLLAETLRHAPAALASPAPAAAALRHWLHALMDTGRKLSVGLLTTALAQGGGNPEVASLFQGLSPAELNISMDRDGQGRGRLLGTVAAAMLRKPAFHAVLPVLLRDLDQALHRRQEEVRQVTVVGQEEAVLRWQAAAYRVLAALVVALAPAAAPPPTPGLALPPGVAAELRSLLRGLTNRLASMMLASLVGVARRFGGAQSQDANSRARSSASANAQTANVDDGRVRAALRATPFCEANLRSLWAILVEWGAPRCFEAGAGAAAEAAAMLRPLWSVFAAAMELDSGAMEPSAMDRLVLEQLAASLAPPRTNAAVQDGQLPAAEGSELAPASAAALREYVLSSLVARYLKRSATPHPSHQRAGVNAVRFAAALLSDARMRVSASEPLATALCSPAAGAVRHLLRGCLEVLWPAQGPPSLGTKEALYRLLERLLQDFPWLLPPLALPWAESPLPSATGTGDGLPADVAQLIRALRVCWELVARDVLCTVETPVFEALPAVDCQRHHRRRDKRFAGLRFLLPLDGPGVAAASQELWGALPPVRDSAALDACSSQWGSSLLPSGAVSHAGSTSALFRPGDFKWSLAQAGLKVLAAMLATDATRAVAASVAEEPGVMVPAGGGLTGSAWVLECMPSLMSSIVMPRTTGIKLLPPFKQLHTEMEAALNRAGIELPKPYRLTAVAPLPVPAIPSLGQQAAPSQQQKQQQQQQQQQRITLHEQQPPNAAAVSRQAHPMAIKQEPLSQAPVEHHQQEAQVVQQAQQVDIGDVSFASLLAMPKGSEICLVGTVRSWRQLGARAVELGPGAAPGEVRVLQLSLYDHRRRKARLALADRSLLPRWQQELTARLGSPGSGARDRIVRASRVQLFDVGAGTPVLRITPHTALEWEPQGKLADRIRQQGGAGVASPASSSDAAAAALLDTGQSPAGHRPESQVTQQLMRASTQRLATQSRFAGKNQAPQLSQVGEACGVQHPGPWQQQTQLQRHLRPLCSQEAVSQAPPSLPWAQQQKKNQTQQHPQMPPPAPQQRLSMTQLQALMNGLAVRGLGKQEAVQAIRVAKELHGEAALAGATETAVELCLAAVATSNQQHE